MHDKMDMQQNFRNVLHQAVEPDSHLQLAVAAAGVMHTAMVALWWTSLELNSVAERLQHITFSGNKGDWRNSRMW
jgi:hypothetical protein